MAEDRKVDLTDLEQDYVFAKLLLNHYGVLHEYFVYQMKYFCVFCCNISVGGTFKVTPAEKLITYDIYTEKTKPLKKSTLLKKIKTKIVLMGPKYKEERKTAAINLTTWTKNLLSWPDADVKVRIDGRDQ